MESNSHKLTNSINTYEVYSILNFVWNSQKWVSIEPYQAAL